MFASLRFTLEKGRSIPAPQYRTPAPLTRRVDSAPFYGTTGVGGDLYVARRTPSARWSTTSRDVRAQPRGRVRALQPRVDLKISEIVDAGQYIVSAVLPEAIFGG